MLSIGVVARQTGLDISTLRKWESRYGFPCPQRRDSGQRAYRIEDVAILQSIARRVAAGERVGQVMRELFGPRPPHPRPSLPGLPASLHSPAVDQALSALRHNDLTALRAQLSKVRHGFSLLTYIDDFVAPLTHAVGDAWAAGELPIHAEHCYSALLESQLVGEIAKQAPPGPARVLLVTPAGEKHMLGLAMTHAILAEAGVSCLRTISDLPAGEIAAVCAAHDFSAVGLSASIHYSPRILVAQIAQLRLLLPAQVELWLGGGGINRLSHLPAGTRTFASFTELIDCARRLPCAVKSALPWS